MNRMRPGLLLLLAAAACSSSESVTSPPLNSPPVRDARVTSGPSYVATDLGSLAGDEESIAWAVDDNGSAAVQSTDFPSTGGRVARWYMQRGASRTMAPGLISAVSGGAMTNVAGNSSNTSVRWTYSISTGFSAPAQIPGRAWAINELADAAGETTSGSTIMMHDGTMITVANPDPAAYTSSEMRDINNAGDVVISYQDGYTLTPDRGYLRTADGVMIEFTPLAGHNSTYVRGVSEEINGKVYVAGISDDDNGSYNAIRWTVDVSSHAIESTEVGSLGSYSVAMSNDGTIVGATTGSNGGAFVWKRGGAITALKTPKGLSSGRPWGVSANGNYIAGDGVKGSYHRAVLWTLQ